MNKKVDPAKLAGSEFCENISKHFKRYKWPSDYCNNIKWLTLGKSKKGHDLVFVKLGEGEKTTLILSGVHADELNPIPIALNFANYLSENPEYLADSTVIIAPLVNPDGFFLDYPTRFNANGVDLNRNFPTTDWNEKALSTWEKELKKNPRRYPGPEAGSEPETQFSIELIDKFKPEKIISIHAPLGFFDYDGPGAETKDPKGTAKEVVLKMSSTSGNYKIVDYSFFPGSLGNYAGKERNIPTITLELSSTDVTKFYSYWKKFLPSLLVSIQHESKKNSSTN